MPLSIKSEGNDVEDNDVTQDETPKVPEAPALPVQPAAAQTGAADPYRDLLGAVVRLPPPALNEAYGDASGLLEAVDGGVLPPWTGDDGLGASLGEMLRVVAVGIDENKPASSWLELIVLAGRWHKPGQRVRFLVSSLPWIRRYGTIAPASTTDLSALDPTRYAGSSAGSEVEWRNYLAPCPNCRREHRLASLVPEGGSPFGVLTCGHCNHAFTYQLPAGAPAPQALKDAPK